MILAAGKGTRVRPITDTVPKPMIPIINRPVMEFLVDLLRRHTFTDIIVSTSYLSHEIESYFREGSRFGVHIAYSFEGYHCDGEIVPEGAGSAGGLRRIQDFSAFFDSTFAVLCGDALIDLDLTEVVKAHRRTGALATIVLKEVPLAEVNRYGIVKIDDEGRILQFQEKPRPADAVSRLANTGIYIFEPEVLDLVPPDRPFDIGGELFPLLARAGLPFYGVSMPFTWIDIGTTSDYWQATQTILKGGLRGMNMPGTEIAPEIRAGINVSIDWTDTVLTGPLYIGSSTRIDPGVTINGPSVIGRNSVIETGARIDACVVGDYTRISGLADLQEKIISGRFCVDRQGRNVELASRGMAFVVDDARERREWNEDQEVLMEFLRSQAQEAR
ncbi:MAG: NDP-sugar synthase [Vicinamibacterales bacterium]